MSAVGAGTIDVHAPATQRHMEPLHGEFCLVRVSESDPDGRHEVTQILRSILVSICPSGSRKMLLLAVGPPGCYVTVGGTELSQAHRAVVMHRGQGRTTVGRDGHASDGGIGDGHILAAAVP